MRFENEFVGLTIKEILTNRLGFSKRAISSLKNLADGILVNGKHATVRYVIKESDVLELKTEDTDMNNEKLVPSSTLPEIIYEDDYIVVINKPPFMPTHQSQGHFYDTLANSLAYYFAQKGKSFVFRSINRLDKNTSGVVLIAKDRLTASKLSNQMKNDKIKKTYLAILKGELSDDEGTISTHIRRKEQSIIIREACEETEDSKIAITEYRVLARANGLTLVKAAPITGRTHQLRVHFAHLGAQILGDDLYGKPSDIISRHALHAHSLSFIHPQNEEYMQIIAPLPDDIKCIIDNNFEGVKV